VAPTIRWTQTALTALLLATSGGTVTGTDPALAATAQSDEARPSRVRILSPQIAPLVRDGLSRSPTLRRVVAAIDASNGIVYVEHGVCRGGSRSCLLGSLVLAGSSRMLRVLIQKTQLDDELVVSLGHELQHAAEVLGKPDVTTDADMRWLFRDIGIQYGGLFETKEAMRVGDAIRRELAASTGRGSDIPSP
jgi:hypothetical protein